MNHLTITHHRNKIKDYEKLVNNPSCHRPDRVMLLIEMYKQEIVDMINEEPQRGGYSSIGSRNG